LFNNAQPKPKMVNVFAYVKPQHFETRERSISCSSHEEPASSPMVGDPTDESISQFQTTNQIMKKTVEMKLMGKVLHVSIIHILKISIAILMIYRYFHYKDICLYMYKCKHFECRKYSCELCFSIYFLWRPKNCTPIFTKAFSRSKIRQAMKSHVMTCDSSNNKTLNARLLARVITGCHYT
jgi:hypothetical protein